MGVNPLAGKPADPSILIDASKLESAYYTQRPDPAVSAQRVAFGTSGHRGCSLNNSFNETHILAITQGICFYRKQQSFGGRLYIGFDTHALVEELIDGSVGFWGEEISGATFLRRDGTVWTTDKDGIVPNLLAAEITARTKRDPGEHYLKLSEEFGNTYYERMDAPATANEKTRLESLSPEAIPASYLAGDPITAKLNKAPGNHSAIGGVKVIATHGRFAARPSGTESIYKIYAESF